MAVQSFFKDLLEEIPLPYDMLLKIKDSPSVAVKETPAQKLLAIAEMIVDIEGELQHKVLHLKSPPPLPDAQPEDLPEEPQTAAAPNAGGERDASGPVAPKKRKPPASEEGGKSKSRSRSSKRRKTDPDSDADPLRNFPTTSTESQ